MAAAAGQTWEGAQPGQPLLLLLLRIMPPASPAAAQNGGITWVLRRALHGWAPLQTRRQKTKNEQTRA
eukprot:11211071-Lingulodinium_polyedra.AAC.1